MPYFFLRMNILKQKLLRSINLWSTELDKHFSWTKRQKSTLRPVPGKCPPEKIFDHFKKHLHTAGLIDLVASEELSGNLPEFVSG